MAAKYSIVLDTETTGLPSSAHAAPISLGAVCIEAGTGKEVSSFHELMIPKVLHTVEYQHAERIHGISIVRLMTEGRPQAEVLERFREWWLGFGKPMLYAYNVSFDSVMLERAGWTPHGYWGPDLMASAAKAMGRTSGKATLTHAAAHHCPGLSRSDKHDALEDARIAAAVGIACGALS